MRGGEACGLARELKGIVIDEDSPSVVERNRPPARPRRPEGIDDYFGAGKVAEVLDDLARGVGPVSQSDATSACESAILLVGVGVGVGHVGRT
jgi:hypothetical protein